MTGLILGDLCGYVASVACSSVHCRHSRCSKLCGLPLEEMKLFRPCSLLVYETFSALVVKSAFLELMARLSGCSSLGGREVCNGVVGQGGPSYLCLLKLELQAFVTMPGAHLGCH